MEKINQIDALIKELSLSTAEIVKYWIEKKKLNIGKLLEDYTCIPINRANFAKLREGMIQYTDDTVSVELRPDKTVKSVILGTFPEYYVVYGDTFVEKLDITKTEADLFLDEHPDMDMASEFKLSQLTKNIEELNGILKKIGKPQWKGRTYWCAENIMQDGATTAHNLPNHTKLLIDVEEPHDFHPIYAYIVKY